MTAQRETLVIGGNGKTGARVAERLRAQSLPVRTASRSTPIPFDWQDERTWDGALAGIRAVYVTYHPDLSVPDAADQMRRFGQRAAAAGVEHSVLLSGRGEPQAEPAENAIKDAGTTWTILRCAFFFQNFSEGLLVPQHNTVTFPAGDVREPFIDCDDIAAVAVAALTDPQHQGRIYDLTGPRAITFAEATALLGRASGRPLRYQEVSYASYAKLLEQFVPREYAASIVDLFRFLLDGHNAHTSNDVNRVLGRSPGDFRDFAANAYNAQPQAGQRAIKDNTVATL